MAPSSSKVEADASNSVDATRAASDPRNDQPTPSALAETISAPPLSRGSALRFAPPVVSDEVGTLGPYRVLKELGKGGMGAVYLALDTRLGRKLALKVMLPEFAADNDAKERFLREARAAAQITHDNVVTVYEADERDGVPYIAMQFLQGYPLDEFLKKKGTPPLHHILRIARETALGLAAAHALGLVHRDIKPANLWLESPNGRVKVLDFGLAKPVGSDAELTKSGAVVGTPAYMSPEQARGLKVDHRTDLFSLGSVLYRLCTGKTPFAGPSVMAVLMALGTDEPTSVCELNPNIPEALATLIHQLLAKKPEERPQTATEVAKRLRAILERPIAPAVAELNATAPSAMSADDSRSQPVVIDPLPLQPPAVVPLSVSAQPKTKDVTRLASPPKKARGKALWIAGIAVVLLGAMAGTVSIVLKINKQPEPEAKAPPDAPPVVIQPPVPPAAVQDTREAEIDRKAAEWIISARGAAIVNDASGEIRSVASLPKGPFRLTGILSFGSSQITDEGLMHVKECKNLNSIWLNNAAVTDAGMIHFANCRDLLFLCLNDTSVTDAGLIHFANCKNLAQIHLNGTQVTGAGLANFAHCRYLRDLALSRTSASDAGLAHLAGCKTLSKLNLQGTKVTDASLALFVNCTGLIELNVRNTQITAAKVAELAKALPACKIEYNGGTIQPNFEADRKNAEWVLSVGGAVRVNGDMRNLKEAADLPKEPLRLTGIDLDGNKQVVDADMSRFAECINLGYLTLSNTAITDIGLAHFKKCKNLWAVHLNGLMATNVGLANFVDCKNIAYLELIGYGELTDEVLVHFADFTNLYYINLSWTQVTDKGLARLKIYKDLGVLVLTETQITDEGLAHLKECTGLTELGLWRVRGVTDKGLTHIKSYKNLTKLCLTGTAVTDVGMPVLKEIAGLEKLELAESDIGDAALAHLKDCKNLKELDLRKTKVTAKGIEKLAMALPACKIEHDGGTIGPTKKP